MTTLQKKQLALLNETVAYYSEDVNRRCKNVTKGCAYDPATVGKEGISEGCAVGRLLSPRMKKQFDEKLVSNGIGMSVSTAWNRLPKRIQVYGEGFLSALQCLHDADVFWIITGFHEAREKEVEHIKNAFGLVY